MSAVEVYLLAVYYCPLWCSMKPDLSFWMGKKMCTVKPKMHAMCNSDVKWYWKSKHHFIVKNTFGFVEKYPKHFIPVSRKAQIPAQNEQEVNFHTLLFNIESSSLTWILVAFQGECHCLLFSLSGKFSHGKRKAVWEQLHLPPNGSSTNNKGKWSGQNGLNWPLGPLFCKKWV